MPRKPSRKQRGGRRPNVFVQPNIPKQGGGDNGESDDASVVVTPSPAISSAVRVTGSTRAATTRMPRRTRSEVYARSFPREVRKMSVLATGVAVALVALSFVL